MAKGKSKDTGAGNFHYFIQGSQEALGLPDDIDERLKDATGSMGI